MLIEARRLVHWNRCRLMCKQRGRQQVAAEVALRRSSVVLVSVAAAFFASTAGAAKKPIDGVFGVMLVIGLADLPISMGVGILKYRLYEIDRLISRTIAYAIVTGVVVPLRRRHHRPGQGARFLVTGRCSGLDAGCHRPVQPAEGAGPARRRPQVQPGTYEAEATVATFTVSLRDAVDLETVRSELLETVNRAIEPTLLGVDQATQLIAGRVGMSEEPSSASLSCYEQRGCLPRPRAPPTRLNLERHSRRRRRRQARRPP